MEEIWPNFFIVGGARCGTTSLYSYLKAVPKIFVPDWKAPNYFIPNPTIDKESYLKLFRDGIGKQAIGESSGYLYDSESPRLIFEQLPHAKIIISLRDPVERAFSHYLQGLGGNYYTDSFEEAYKIYQEKRTNENLYDIMKHHMIKGSFYSEPVKKFLKIFGKKQVKIIIFEEYASDVKKSVKDILEFLEVDDYVPNNVDKAYNPYRQPLGKIGRAILQNPTIKGVAKSILPGDSARNLLRVTTGKKGKKPTLGSYERKELEKIFQQDVENLKSILGRNFPWSIS
jgi:hypothetical protein